MHVWMKRVSCYPYFGFHRHKHRIKHVNMGLDQLKVHQNKGHNIKNSKSNSDLIRLLAIDV